ncbi:MAG: o-succinylbenzoate synthase [Opitutus sp.]|nr:o-succinylbenzoate synthase [Opitutus sp.]
MNQASASHVNYPTVKIQTAEIRHIALPLITPWRTAYGEDAAIYSVLVRLTSEGIEGWGESCPLYAPTYSPESALSAYETCREFFLPRIVGREFATAADLVECLAVFKGNPFAKAAAETAWWALHSKRQGLPLWRALGGVRSTTRCGHDFGVQDTIDGLLALIGKAVDEGFPRIKLKVKRGWDIEVLEAVRGAFPAAVVHVDCNAGYDLRDDWATLKAFDRFNLAMIEQPLADTDLIDHAELQSRIATPVCLDESIKSPRDFRVALKLGACRVVNVKPGRVGGLFNAIQIHDLARDAGMPAWVGGMLESGVGAAICAALGTLPGFTYPADIFPSRRFYARDITEREIQLNAQHCVDLGDRVGVGFEPIPERLESVTVAKASFPE